MIVKTSLSFFAGFYTLASELIDLEKEATIIAATESSIRKDTFLQLSFAWDITLLDMIFKNGMLLNIGIGGNKSKKKALTGEYGGGNKYWNLDHTYLTFGTGVIF